MRNEFYADSRDVHKWSVIINEANTSPPPRAVRWVVMLRPDEGGHILNTNPENGALPAVVDFFAAERRRVSAGKTPDLVRTRLLFGRLGVPLIIHPDSYPSGEVARRGYATEVLGELNRRTHDHREVVFLDPDNGVGTAAGGGPGGRQVHEDRLISIWSGLRSGDTLSWIQFQWFEQDWVDGRRERAAKVLGLPPTAIRSWPWANVCLYAVNKV